MPRSEILSPEGLRSDGRRYNEIRQFKARMSLPTCSSFDGSALCAMGLTTVLCTVSGPHEPDANKRAQMKADAAYLHVDYTVLPFAGQDRKKAGRTDKRMQEICLALQQTFSQAAILKLYPRTQIDVRLQIVQQDGGALACAINAATLALIDAGIPLYHFIAACSLGAGTAQALLDVTALEESDIPWLTLATEGHSGKISFLQCETRLGLDAFDACLEYGVLGSQAVRGLLEGVCREAGKEYKAKLER
ncbi:hypothetical protein BCR37DRAFT_348815 [Protomyces lactucae-debilis]|uniref:Ribosomal RNA-processing protein 41 n=1 Tax=Protomyces lactucae-debilis TaxID=2754530 RepID=A0A1Y2F9A4_PROLT|nr:uncharacterized protein BCR37DRAFT_348815 [Protomyces lactucae-debilis]ORY80469.1 hypothetical protein BCR37DRAFT_348815 [Protomyces lactucae-debilis]